MSLPPFVPRSAQARRQAPYAAHQRFLRNVTGLTFGPPFMDMQARGVAFRHTLSPRSESQFLPVEILSVIREREDMSHG